MVATGTEYRLEELAQSLFEILTQLNLSIPRKRRRGADLKEMEYLTLALLHDHGTMIVGDIQRQLGVLPAQMSRVIRGLEARDAPMISCHINPRDKRKVNVSMTPAGQKALLDYQAVRTSRIVEMLRRCSEEELEHLAKVLDRLHALVATRHGN
jgi:DNA-binding MarR family transcriptional regulator